MLRILMPQKLLYALLLFSLPAFGQGYHRINQVVARGNGVAANVVPYATVNVCVAGSNCATAQNAYSDITLTHLLNSPVVADASGNYSYYTATPCVDEQVSAVGQGTLLLSNVCSSNASGGAGIVSVNGDSTISATTTSGAVALHVLGTKPNQAGCAFASQYNNDFTTQNFFTITSTVAPTDTTINVNSTTGYPATGVLSIADAMGEETVCYTGKTSTSFTVTRGFYGTTAATHAIGIIGAGIVQSISISTTAAPFYAIYNTNYQTYGSSVLNAPFEVTGQIFANGGMTSPNQPIFTEELDVNAGEVPGSYHPEFVVTSNGNATWLNPANPSTAPTQTAQVVASTGAASFSSVNLSSLNGDFRYNANTGLLNSLLASATAALLSSGTSQYVALPPGVFTITSFDYPCKTDAAGNYVGVYIQGSLWSTVIRHSGYRTGTTRWDSMFYHDNTCQAVGGLTDVTLDGSDGTRTSSTAIYGNRGLDLQYLRGNLQQNTFRNIIVKNFGDSTVATSGNYYLGAGYGPAPTYTVNGTAGSTSYTYSCGGTGAPMPNGLSGTQAEFLGTSVSVLTGNATLGGSNTITLTCPAATGVNLGATSFNVRRTSNGGGLGNGYIGNVAPGGSLTDNGITASSTPAAPASGFGMVGEDLSSLYDDSIYTGPQGGAGPTPPLYCYYLLGTAFDSTYTNLGGKNCTQAGLRVDGGTNTITNLHVFGYGGSGAQPYQYFPNYLYAEYGSNTLVNPYCDSPKVSCYYLANTGNTLIVNQFDYWNIGGSWTFPTTDNIATLANANATSITMTPGYARNMPAAPGNSTAFTGSFTTEGGISIGRITNASTEIFSCPNGNGSECWRMQGTNGGRYSLSDTGSWTARLYSGASFLGVAGLSTPNNFPALVFQNSSFSAFGCLEYSAGTGEFTINASTTAACNTVKELQVTPTNVYSNVPHYHLSDGFFYPQFAVTGTFTNGSAIITSPTTTGTPIIGQTITATSSSGAGNATGIPGSTTISATSPLTMSANFTGTTGTYTAYISGGQAACFGESTSVGCFDYLSDWVSNGGYVQAAYADFGYYRGYGTGLTCSSGTGVTCTISDATSTNTSGEITLVINGSITGSETLGTIYFAGYPLASAPKLCALSNRSANAGSIANDLATTKPTASYFTIIDGTTAPATGTYVFGYGPCI